MIGLYKAELIRSRGPWRGPDQIEYATLEWVDWWNHRRLLQPIGMIPPAEKEATYNRQTTPNTNTASQNITASIKPGAIQLGPHRARRLLHLYEGADEAAAERDE